MRRIGAALISMGVVASILNLTQADRMMQLNFLAVGVGMFLFGTVALIIDAGIYGD